MIVPWVRELRVHTQTQAAHFYGDISVFIATCFHPPFEWLFLVGMMHKNELAEQDQLAVMYLSLTQQIQAAHYFQMFGRSMHSFLLCDSSIVLL